MKQNVAYKFRLYPNEEQQILFQKTFGGTRFIYNQMLSDKIEYYKETGQTLHNTPAQYKNEFEWLRELDSLALSNAQLNLESAYKSFFKDKKKGFPKFKSKKKSAKRYTTNNINNSIRLHNNTIKLPKIGFVKLNLHRQIPPTHKIKSVTISQTPTNKYFISILTEYELIEKEVELDINRAIGMDYSSHDFYVDNNNNYANYPKFYRNMQSKLAVEQRKLSHMKLHSNNYKKQQLKVNRIHEKILNCRKDWLHKQSTMLSNNYDYICVEDLNMKNMSQSLYLGKSTMDNGWGMFVSYLQYKQFNRGHKLIMVDKWFPSSKTCNNCGNKNSNLKLSDRIWVCPSCGSLIERDYNAAKNILQEGLKYI